MQQGGDLALSLLDHGCHPLALELHAIDAEKKKKKFGFNHGPRSQQCLSLVSAFLFGVVEN